MIDAQRWQKRFWHNALELDQARTASHLYISRQDIVEPKRLDQIQESLRKHEIRAVQVGIEEFITELAALANQPLDTESRRLGASGLTASREEHSSDGQESHEHEHNHESNHHFASFEAALPDYVSRASMSAFLRALPKEVIRAKGIVRFDDQPNDFFVFQKVDRFDEPQFFCVGKTPGLNRPVALFIGPQLPEAAICAALRKLG